MRTDSPDTRNRLEDRAAAWGVVVERTMETETAILAFGRRQDRPVVLKVVRSVGNEWRGGEILDAFGGNGMVRVYEHVDGAMLMEGLSPATRLVSLAMDGRDDQATEILADVMSSMRASVPVSAPTVRDWGTAFDWYLGSGDTRIDTGLVLEAKDLYARLCDSLSSPRFLHGDLHHYNVLWDAERDWVAIDPKGVVGELEYEAGAALRNPYEAPALFVDPARIRSRVDCFARRLRLDPDRLLAWAFAQAVLSAVWMAEDGFAVHRDDPSFRLADAIRPMLSDRDYR